MVRQREIEGSRRRLMVILTRMLAMLPGLDVPVVRRSVHLAVLALLLPAEAATRRLIAVLAHSMIVTPGPPRAAPTARIPRGKERSVSAFALFDPRKHPKPDDGRKPVPGPGPAVTGIGVDRHVSYTPPARPSPDDEVSARALCRRVAALRAALEDPARQALRLARTFARGKAKWLRVMRPGRPPGHREGGTRDVDEVLRDCHWMALTALREPLGTPAPP